MLNAKLDEPLEPIVYAQYLEYLANVSRDKANMRSILLKADLSHEWNYSFDKVTAWT